MGLFRKRTSTWEDAQALGWVTWNPTPTYQAIPALLLAELRLGAKYFHLRALGSSDWDPDQPLSGDDLSSLTKEGKLGFSLASVDRLGRGALIAAEPVLMTVLGASPAHCEVVFDRLRKGQVPLEFSTEAVLSRGITRGDRDEEIERFKAFLADRPQLVPPAQFREWERIEGIGYLLLAEEMRAAMARGDDVLAEVLFRAHARWLQTVYPKGSLHHGIGEEYARSITQPLPLEPQIELLKEEFDAVAGRMMLDETIVLFRAIVHATAAVGHEEAIDLLADPERARDLADLALDDPKAAVEGFVELIRSGSEPEIP